MTRRPYRVERVDALARIMLAEPERLNALGQTFWNEFGNDVGALDDGATRALIIEAEGDHFCAGVDTELFSSEAFLTDSPQQRLQIIELAKYLQSVFETLETVRFPTISVIQGACIGAGLELVACCDIRVASLDAYFQIAETEVGIMADLGALQRVHHLTSYSIATDMALTGRRVSSEEAKALALVTYLEDDKASAMDRAEALAARFVERSPTAIAGIKQALRFSRDHTVSDSLDQCAYLQGAIFDPTGIRTALDARRDNRAPSHENLKRQFRSWT